MLNPNALWAYAKSQSVDPTQYQNLSAQTTDASGGNIVQQFLQPYIADATKDAKFLGIALVALVVLGMGVYIING